MNKNVVVTVALVLLVGAGGFFGGMTYQKSQTSTTGSGQSAGRMGQGGPGGYGGPGGMNGRNGGQGMSRPVSGEIIEKDATSITVRLDDGSTKIVMVPATSSINKAEKGSVNDLKTGENVMVMGTTNSDGSVTAASINVGQIRFNRPNGSQPNGSQTQQPGQTPAQ